MTKTQMSQPRPSRAAPERTTLTTSRRAKRPSESRANSELSASSNQLLRVPIDAIVVPPRRIRRDLGDVDALALSLHQHGQLAPVIVYEVGDRYHLIAGERRLEATRRLHQAQVSSGQATPATITAIVRQMLPGENPHEIELVENAQRRELTDEEEADAFIRLVRDGGREMREVAALAGRSVAYVSKRVRMFEDGSLRPALMAGRITPAQAEELLSVAEERRQELLELAVSAGWGSKQIREAVQAYASRPENMEEGLPGPGRRPTASGADDDDYDYALGDDADMGLDTSPDEERAGIGIVIGRPRDLTRRISELNAILRDLRPFQLKPGDDRALRQLWNTLRQLAQAPRVQTATTFPSLADAESLARRRRQAR
jgi:ParB family chromosome partitioning protein